MTILTLNSPCSLRKRKYLQSQLLQMSVSSITLAQISKKRKQGLLVYVTEQC
jgi:hypothetical protein